MALKLHGTPLSHFTRKIRILLGELGVQFEMVFANELPMCVPTLVDGDREVFDSDHIARYLVGCYDASDWFGVKNDDPVPMNILAVANAVMRNEAIEEGLAWLDRTIKLDAPMTWGDITLVCMWDHVRHYKLVDGLDRYPRIAERVAQFASRPAVASTTPEASLAAATAAGWKPPS